MKTHILLSYILFSLAFPKPTVAAELAAHSAEFTVDTRVLKLKSYLESHNSPMSGEAAHFVSEADRLGLDWKLLPAIAGVESTFGKRIPRNSFNSYGWGIFTGKSDGIHFSSWADGITKVSEGLKYRYIERGATSIEQIGRIYAASPVWSRKVRFFMDKLETYEINDVSQLAFTI